MNPSVPVNDAFGEQPAPPAPPGTFAYDAATETYAVGGAGADIWDNADQFTYAFKSLPGDGSVIARVVADDGKGGHVWTKAGVMIRETLMAGSPHAYMALTRGGNGCSFQWRLAPTGGASLNADGPPPTIAPPCWLKIERKGNDFCGSVSVDGEAWVTVGTPVTIVMQEQVLIGLAVTSHVAGTIRTWTFDHVRFTGNVVADGPITTWKVIDTTQNTVAPLYLTMEDKADKIEVAPPRGETPVDRADEPQHQVPSSVDPSVSDAADVAPPEEACGSEVDAPQEQLWSPADQICLDAVDVAPPPGDTLADRTDVPPLRMMPSLDQRRLNLAEAIPSPGEGPVDEAVTPQGQMLPPVDQDRLDLAEVVQSLSETLVGAADAPQGQKPSSVDPNISDPAQVIPSRDETPVDQDGSPSVDRVPAGRTDAPPEVDAPLPSRLQASLRTAREQKPLWQSLEEEPTRAPVPTGVAHTPRPRPSARSYSPRQKGRNGRQKLMTALVPVLAIALVAVVKHSLGARPAAKAAGAPPCVVAAPRSANLEVVWEVPALWELNDRDPMQLTPPPATVTVEGPEAQVRPMWPPVELTVTGILYSDDRPMAIVNTQVVQAGQEVSGATVEKIDPDGVQFEKDGVRWKQAVNK